MVGSWKHRVTQVKILERSSFHEDPTARSRTGACRNLVVLGRNSLDSRSGCASHAAQSSSVQDDGATQCAADWRGHRKVLPSPR